MTTMLRPPDWTLFAACDGHPTLDPTAWDNATPQARTICAECPVRYDCALEALNNAIPDGMWGGLDPTDRAYIAEHTGHDTPGLPRHGTRARRVHRLYPCSCDLCRQAHRRWARERRAAGAWKRPTAPTFEELTAPAGRGRHTAWPGQLALPVTASGDTRRTKVAA
jgi:hypothetical protein